jgi:hypothetical protein
MITYKIATILGDGTGTEVVCEGLKIMAAAAQKLGFKLFVWLLPPNLQILPQVRWVIPRRKLEILLLNIFNFELIMMGLV